MAEAKLRVGIYTRLSKDREGTQTATKRQRADCERYARDKGWRVVEQYEDVDLSAYQRKVVRKDFERMLTDIELGTIDVVLVWRTDRLVRQLRTLVRFLDACEANNVELVSVTEPFDAGTGMGLFMLKQFALFAEQESAVKSERLRRKHLELAQDGKLAGGGHRPFGFQRDRLHVNKREAKLIVEAADRVLAGETLYALAVDWNRRGIKTPAGNTWVTTAIRQVLMSGRVCGQREHRGAIVSTATWPAIIEPETGEQLRALLGAPGRRSPRASVRSYLLTGTLLCGRCGAKLIARRRDDGARSYMCLKSPGYPGCGRLRVVAEPLETMVVEMLLHALDTPKLRRRRVDDPKVRPTRVSPQQEILRVERKLESLARQWADDKLDDASWRSARTALDTRLDQARARLAEQTQRQTKTGYEGRGGELRKTWPTMALGARRAVVEAVIEAITIAPSSAPRGSPRFDPERVTVTWRV